MSAIARTGPLYGTRHIPALAHIHKCQHVELEAVLAVLVVEVYA